MRKLKWLSLLVAYCMFMLGWFVQVWAATDSGSCGENLTWEFVDGTLTIDGTGEMYSYFWSLSPWYEYRNEITSVIIGEHVTSIGDNAFKECENLNSITISESVTDIGLWAFENCINLEDIVLENEKVMISNSSFFGSAWYEIQEEGIVYLGNTLYGYKGEMPEDTSLELKEGTTVIASDALASQTNLISITIPKSVESIGKYAFYNCENLTDVYYDGTKEEWNEIFIGEENDSLKNAILHSDDQEPEWNDKHSDGSEHIFEGRTVMAEGSTVQFVEMCIQCGSIKRETGSLLNMNLSSDVLEAKIYTMDEWAKDFLTIPKVYPMALKILPNSTASVFYRILSSESSVEITEDGILVPKVTTWYWYSTGFYSYATETPNPNEECIGITHDAEFGETEIEVICGNERYYLTVEVCDYTEVYTNEEIDRYVEENFIDGMTIEETLHAICKFPASYDYSEKYSSASGMILSGGGDCWASTSLILAVCEKLGIEATARDASKDYGSGSAHTNVLLTIAEGEYYELDAGFAGTAPRDYYVYHRTSLFSYRTVADGLEIYQYDGEMTEETILLVPEYIDGQMVVSIADSCFSYANVRGVMLPDTLKEIGERAFAGCSYLETLNIPISVERIGGLAFCDCDSLNNLSCSAGNAFFASKDGVLYDKDFTKVIAVSACDAVIFPETVECIGEYAFYYNEKLTNLVLPEHIKRLEEGAIAHCDNLKKVVLKGVEEVGAFAFAENDGVDIYFESNAPIFDAYAFYCAKADVYYSILCDGWTAEIFQDYTGEVAWYSYEPEEEMNFSDVGENDWFFDAVQYVYEKGMMSGDASSFKPHDNMTRAMMVTTLYRLSGSPKVTDYTTTSLFSDVEVGSWYEDAVNWAYNTKVTTGYTDDNGNSTYFGSNDSVTREQLAVFLYRYAEKQGYDVTTRGDIHGYVGYQEVSEYAKEAMEWAVGVGLISGIESVENGVTVYDLAPKGSATRAQLATILMRFCNHYEI